MTITITKSEHDHYIRGLETWVFRRDEILEKVLKQRFPENTAKEVLTEFFKSLPEEAQYIPSIVASIGIP